MIKTIRRILILVVIFGILTAFIDYTRMISGEIPIFNISKYDEVSNVESYRGLFYQASRKTKVNSKEPLIDSSNMTFTVLTININVPHKFKEQVSSFTIETKENINCEPEATIYYEGDNLNIYTYCITSLKIKKLGETESKDLLSYLKKDNNIIYDIIDNTSYTGLYKNKIEMYKTEDTTFINNGLAIYKCNNSLQDIYITKKEIPMQDKFCIENNNDN